jgi:hypothetical protein
LISNLNMVEIPPRQVAYPCHSTAWSKQRRIKSKYKIKENPIQLLSFSTFPCYFTVTATSKLSGLKLSKYGHKTAINMKCW